MILFRIAILLLGAYIIWRLIQRHRAARRVEAPPTQQSFEPMQRCQSCGTYLPAHALSRSGRCGRCSD